jgi:hypothetical protein
VFQAHQVLNVLAGIDAALESDHASGYSGHNAEPVANWRF